MGLNPFGFGGQEHGGSGDFGSGGGMNVGDISLRVAADVTPAIAAMRGLGVAIKTADIQAKVFAATLKATGVGLAVAAFSKLASAVEAASERSIKIGAVYQNLAVDISAARTASQGMISDFDLAKKANEAMRLGIVETGADFAELVEASTKLGLSVGIDATAAMDKLTTAIARSSTRRLDDLGIMLSQGEAHLEYAAILKKSVKELTKEEKAEAFAVVAKVKSAEAAEQATLRISEMNNKINSATTGWANFKDSLQGGDSALGAAKESMRILSEEELVLIRNHKMGAEESEELHKAVRKVGMSLRNVSDIVHIGAAAQHEYNRRVREGNDALKAQAQLANDKINTENAAKIATVEHDLALAKLNGDTEAIAINTEWLANARVLLGTATQLQIDREKELAAATAAAAARKPRGGGRRAKKKDTAADDLLAGQNFFAAQNKAAFEAEVATLERQVHLAEQVIEVKQAQGEATFQLEQNLAEGQAREMERLGMLDEARDIRHNAEVARFEHIQTLKEREEKLAEEREKSQIKRDKAEAKRLKQQVRMYSQAFDGIVGVQMEGFGASIIAAEASEEAFGKAFNTEVQQFAKAGAMKLSIQAAVHTAKGLALIATGIGAPAGALELTAAGIAAAGALGLAATYGIAHATASDGGGGGASASGPGNAFNLGGGRDGQSAPDAPISPLEDGLGASRPSGASSGGGTVINVSGGLVDGEKLARILQDYDRTNGRILA